MGEKQGQQQTKVELWGEEGASAFDAALNAVHAFAQATGCEPGRDVFRHIIEQHNALVVFEDMTQAPTPGPLTAVVTRSGTITFEDGAYHLKDWTVDCKGLPVGEAYKAIFDYALANGMLAPTAPVEASGSERERDDKLASVLTELIPAVRAYLMTGDVMSQGIKRTTWEPVLNRAQAALNGAAKTDTAASYGVVETIRTRLLGIAPDDQDVTLEDSDWLLILGALEGRK